MISRKNLRARLNLPKRRVSNGSLEVFESHNFNGGFKNWGDHISGEIVSHFFDVDFEICTDPSVAGKTLVVGSVLSNCYPTDSVWGAGCIAPGEIGHSKGKLQIHALRGPLTLQELRKSFDVPAIPFGDPALLMGRIHKLSSSQPDYEYGVIPHWVDLGLLAVEKLRHLGVKVIDIRQSTEDLLNEISSVKKLLSSSLHGLILADSMSIPNCRVQFSSNVIGGDFKFLDYCLSVGRTHMNHKLDETTSKSTLQRLPFNDCINWNADAILNNAPWDAK